MTKEILIEKYVENKKMIKELENVQNDILDELKQLYEHKKGEIVEWTETNRRKRVSGGWFSPAVFEDLPDKKHTAVLTRVRVSVYTFTDEPYVSYNEEFREIKKDGGISKNCCRVDKDELVWTGKIHKDFKCE